MEKEKKLKGLQKMKSNLWKQRRDKDEMIRDTWKNVRRAAEIEEIWTETSLEEQEDFEEWWGEQLTLITEERQRLEELERWHRTLHHSATMRPSSQQEESDNPREEDSSPQEDQAQAPIHPPS